MSQDAPTVPPSPTLFVEVEEAAAMCLMSVSMWHKMFAAGRIGPSKIKFGKLTMYSRAELEAWAAAGAPPLHEWQRRKGAA